MARILIVDDDPVYSDMAKQRLERAGHEVSTHNGPFGATVAATKPGIDLVILDVFMPGLSGPDLLTVMRGVKSGLNVKVIFCSSMDAEPLRELAERHGADGHIPKSSDRNEFVSTVERVLTASETGTKRASS